MRTYPSENKPITPTLSQVLKDLKAQGYTAEFQVVETGLTYSGSSEVLAPEAVKVVETHRFEGMSNPADMSVLYVLESESGVKGTLVDAFGTYASEPFSEILRRLG